MCCLLGVIIERKKMYFKKIYEIIKDIDDVVFLIINDF